MKELKSCPFCDDGIETINFDSNTVSVKCFNCGAKGKEFKYSEYPALNSQKKHEAVNRAVENWNNSVGKHKGLLTDTDRLEFLLEENVLIRRAYQDNDNDGVYRGKYVAVRISTLAGLPKESDEFDTPREAIDFQIRRKDDYSE